jgi:hypothetical protein
MLYLGDGLDCLQFSSARVTQLAEHLPSKCRPLTRKLLPTFAYDRLRALRGDFSALGAAREATPHGLTTDC